MILGVADVSSLAVERWWKNVFSIISSISRRFDITFSKEQFGPSKCSMKMWHVTLPTMSKLNYILKLVECPFKESLITDINDKQLQLTKMLNLQLCSN